MMRRSAFLFLLLGGFAAVPASAQPGASAGSPVAAKASTANPIEPVDKDAALRLARLVYDEEAVVQQAVRLVDTSLAPAFKANQDFRSIEADFPGFLDALIAEMKPLVIRYTHETAPEYQDRIARIYAAHFSAAESDDLLKFFQSPTGQKLLRAIREGASMDSVMAEVMKDPDSETSSSAIEMDRRAAITLATKAMDKSDAPALIALTEKPYAARMVRVGEEIRKLDVELMNEPEPEFEAEMEKLFERVLAKFEGE